jgi:hypothetical protein
LPELPPIRVRIDVDDQQLIFAEGQLEMFGKNVGRHLDPADQALKKLGDDAERETGRVVKGMDDVAKSSDNAKTKLLDFGAAGVQPMNALIGLGVALGVVLAPLLAYTAGLAGALALGGLVLGGMGILGAGVIALAEHYNNWAEAAKNVTTAQKAVTTATEQQETALEALKLAQLSYDAHPTALNLQRLKDAQEQAAESTQKMTDAQNKLTDAQVKADNPWTKLMTNLNQMALTLGQQATPAAERLLNFFNALIPKVEELGSRLITWFGGDRLSSALGIVLGLFDTFTKTLQRVGDVVGPVFDKLLEHPQTFQKAFGVLMDLTVGSIKTVLQWTQNLSDWWAQHGDALSSTAKTDIEIIGKAFSVLFDALGKLILKLDETEKAIGTYSQSLTDRLNPATEDAAKRTDHLSLVLGQQGLGGILGRASQDFGGIAAPILQMGQNLATVAGWALSLSDKLGSLHGWMGAVRDIIKNQLLGTLEDLAIRGLEAATPIYGIANAFNAIFNTVNAALGKFREWQNRGSAGGGGGGGGGEMFQHGGMISPGAWGHVGEVARELVYAMPGGGALVVPEAGGNRGGGGITINISGASLGQLDEQKILNLFRRYVQLYG